VKEKFDVNLSFQNKVALVTGAGSGMGLVTARAFAEAGAAVALADVHQNAVRSAAEELVAAMKRNFFAFAFALALVNAGCGADNSTTNSGPRPNSPTETSLLKPPNMKVRLKVEDKVITATLNDSKTTRDFISLLPLTFTMNDLFRREKFAHLPRAISKEGKRTHSYEVGQVVYWSPGPDVAIFYRNDGEKIPNPGIIVIGKIDSSVAALDVAGSVKVTIEFHDEH
jgi:hypothetical protein